MMQVYGLWCSVGAYEGADVCLGIYSDYVKARSAELKYLSENSEDEVYLTKINVDESNFENWPYDAIGEFEIGRAHV